MKKYELLTETFVGGVDYACIHFADHILYRGHTLYRIKALKDFNDVKAGDIGGYISDESCLSQEGDCWVYDDAKVLPNARVFDNAQVRGKSHIEDNAKVYGNAIVNTSLGVYNNAEVYDNAIVKDDVCVYGNAKVCGDVIIDSKAQICSNAYIKSKNDFKCTTIYNVPITIFNDIHDEIYFKFIGHERSYKDFCENCKESRFYALITKAIREFIQGRV